MAADELCSQCGAKLLHRRVFLGVPKPENFILTAEENKPDVEVEEDAGRDDWQFLTRAELARFGKLTPPPPEPMAGVRWGGFFRRANALALDLFIIVLLSSIMGAMAYVGYKVGLGAHGQVISGDNAAALFAILTLGGLGLTAAYFIVMHGLGGQTIGKMLLGLR
ncbi:MAG: RDD family protein, partial [Candidatus Binatia bacterium]